MCLTQLHLLSTYSAACSVQKVNPAHEGTVSSEVKTTKLQNVVWELLTGNKIPASAAASWPVSTCV